MGGWRGGRWWLVNTSPARFLPWKQQMLRVLRVHRLISLCLSFQDFSFCCLLNKISASLSQLIEHTDEGVGKSIRMFFELQGSCGPKRTPSLSYIILALSCNLSHLLSALRGSDAGQRSQLRSRSAISYSNHHAPCRAHHVEIRDS
jgi:hypothetical protein